MTEEQQHKEECIERALDDMRNMAGYQSIAQALVDGGNPALLRVVLRRAIEAYEVEVSQGRHNE